MHPHRSAREEPLFSAYKGQHCSFPCAGQQRMYRVPSLLEVDQSMSMGIRLRPFKFCAACFPCLPNCLRNKQLCRPADLVSHHGAYL